MGIGRTVVTAQGLRRWALVLGVILALAAVPVAISAWPVRASGHDPAALRDRIAASGSEAYHGYAQSTGLLGLPSLPNLTQVSALLSGTTEMRTWYASPQSWRVDVLGEGTERDVYQTPQAQFVWDFGDNQITRVNGGAALRLPRAADLTPPELVRRLLATAAGDRVEDLGAKRVAGVAAEGLRLVPTGPDTTVAQVDIWADPRHGLPLQAEITAKGGVRPVFVTRFLEIHFDTPDPAVLTPPAPRAGIGYTEADAPDILGTINRWRPVSLPPVLGGVPRRDALSDVAAAGVYGTGLASFVAVGLPGRFGNAAFRQIDTFGQEVPVPGGRDAAMITTGLLNLLVVRNGFRTLLVAGLVGPDLLRRVAVDLAEVPG
ncbi:hypothetical protein ACQPZX_14840 [Actinoplanes sp. CA-142083]|uniref:hypothetical protein n=1 Tax=Actinoplanes sp. CA-142083 TaxID=3239903 RepID=UPI003D8B215E